MGPLAFELACWMVAAIAMTLAPRTGRRWTLLLASCAAATATGLLTRLANPTGWNVAKVDPSALVSASAAAALVALAFELAEWRSRRLLGKGAV